MVFFYKDFYKNDYFLGWYFFIDQSTVYLNIILNKIIQYQSNKHQLLLVIWTA